MCETKDVFFVCKISSFSKVYLFELIREMPLRTFHVRQKICFCCIRISNVHKSIIVMNLMVGVCSKARRRNFRPDKTLLLVYLTLLSFTNYPNELQNCTFIKLKYHHPSVSAKGTWILLASHQKWVASHF